MPETNPKISRSDEIAMKELDMASLVILDVLENEPYAGSQRQVVERIEDGMVAVVHVTPRIFRLRQRRSGDEPGSYEETCYSWIVDNPKLQRKMIVSSGSSLPKIFTEFSVPDTLTLHRLAQAVKKAKLSRAGEE